MIALIDKAWVQAFRPYVDSCFKPYEPTRFHRHIKMCESFDRMAKQAHATYGRIL